MKKILSFLLLCLVCLGTQAADVARFYTSLPRIIETNGRTSTTVELDVYLTNNVNISNFTFKARLPEGVSVEKAELSDRVINPSLATNPNKLKNNPKYASSYVAIAQNSSEPMSVTGNEGRIMTLTLKINNLKIKSGNYDIELYDLCAGGPDLGQPIFTPGTTIPFTLVSRLGDANLNRVVEVTDVDAVADMLLDKREYKAEANVQYTDDVMTIGDITALIELLKNN